jgi:hypothetical protein
VRWLGGYCRCPASHLPACVPHTRLLECLFSDNESSYNQPDLANIEQQTERDLWQESLRRFLVINHTANLRQNSRELGVSDSIEASAGESATSILALLILDCPTSNLKVHYVNEGQILALMWLVLKKNVDFNARTKV